MRRRRTWRSKCSRAVSIVGAICLKIVLMWWNARGILDKEVVCKEMMIDKGAVYCGVGESNTYRNSSATQLQEVQVGSWA